MWAGVGGCGVPSLNSLARSSLGSQLCCSEWKRGRISPRNLRIAPDCREETWPGLLEASLATGPARPAPLPLATCSCLPMDCGPPALRTGRPEVPECVTHTCLALGPHRRESVT